MAKLPPFPTPENDPAHKRTAWETIIITTPVLLTVMATVLAGLSSSEMSLAQYYRSTSAQMQSKVSDQWGYFQAKKLRSEQCGNTEQILQTIVAPALAFTPQDMLGAGDRLVAAMKSAAQGAGAQGSGALSSHVEKMQALVAEMKSATTQPDMDVEIKEFINGQVPKTDERPIDDPQITEALQSLAANVPDVDLEKQAGKISQAQLDAAFKVADQNTAAFEDALAKQNGAVQKMSEYFQQVSRQAGAFVAAAESGGGSEGGTEAGGQGGGDSAGRIGAVKTLASQLDSAFAVARLRFNAARYEREAHFNQVLAQLYELQVRRESFTSDRHRERSKEFFYGMLGAQAGVTVATFSLAVRRRNLLWGLAASAGLAAVTFAAYVYMFV
jgi:hypothetical protein